MQLLDTFLVHSRLVERSDVGSILGHLRRLRVRHDLLVLHFLLDLVHLVLVHLVVHLHHLVWTCSISASAHSGARHGLHTIRGIRWSTADFILASLTAVVDVSICRSTRPSCRAGAVGLVLWRVFGGNTATLLQVGHSLRPSSVL